MIGYKESLKFLTSKTPFHVVLFPTARCNCGCSHCFYSENIEGADPEEELSLEEIEKISENLGHVKYLSISGGEPSLRDDIDEICEIFYENNGLQNVAFHTNGSLPEKTKKISENIMENCPDLSLNVCLSADDLENKHDEIRDYDGLFDRLLQTIELLRPLRKEGNFSLDCVTVLTYQNKDRIEEIHDFFENKVSVPHGIILVRGDVPGEIKEGTKEKYLDIIGNWERKGDLRGNGNLLDRLRKYLESFTHQVILDTLRKDEAILPCQAGRKSVVISETGDLFPCEILDKKFGNLRDVDYDPKKLLFSEKGEEIKRSIRESGCHCTWEVITPINLLFSLKPLYISKLIMERTMRKLGSYIKPKRS